MALTKVSGGILDPGINVAGIVTATGFDGPFVGGTGDSINAGIITATGLDVNGNADISGSLTVGSGGLDLNGNGDVNGNFVIGGDLTVNGTTTTLDTQLVEVDKIEVDTDGSNVAVAVTHAGSGDLLRLHDGTSQVVTVDDQGNVGLGSAIPAKKLDVNGDLQLHDGYGYGNHIAYTKSNTTLTFPSASLTNVAQVPTLTFGDRTSGGNFKIYNDWYTTHLRQVGVGGLAISSEETHITINGGNGSGGVQQSIRIEPGATEGVKLYQANALRFETDANGIKVSKVGGIPQVAIAQTTSTAYSTNGTIAFVNSTGTTCQINGRTGSGSTAGDMLFLVNNSGREGLAILEDGKVRVPDTGSFVVGTDNDMQITHQSGENHFLLNSGNTFFKGDVSWGVRTASNASIIQVSGSARTVDLYGSGSKVLSTSGIGVTIRQGLYVENAEFNMTTNGNKILDFETGGSNVVNFRHNPSDSGNTTFLKATHGGSLELYDDSDGAVKLTTQSSGVFISGAVRLQGTEAAYRSSQAQPLIYRSGSTSGSYPFNNFGHLIIQTRNDGSNRDIIFATGTNSANQIIINSSGHLVPGAAGTYNLGSSSAEWGDVYIADSKGLQLGNSQELDIRHQGSTGYIQHSGSGYLFIHGNDIALRSQGQKNYIVCDSGDSVDLYFDAANHTTAKLKTSATGIEVHGEVAASQDYPNFRPTLDFNFVAEKKLDSRIAYYRTGPASYHDESGKVVIVGDNQPRFDHTFPEYWYHGNVGDSNSRGISKGLLMEPTRTNLYKNNHNLTTANDHGSVTQTVNTTETTAPDGTFTATKVSVSGGDQWTRWDINNGLDVVGVNFTDTFSTSIYMKTVGTSNVNVALDFGDAGNNTFSVGQEWKRYAISNVHVNYGGSTKFIDIVFNGNVYIWGLQCENGSHPTSYIPTSGTTVTRGNEYAVIDEEDFTDFYNPVESSVLAVGTMHRPIAAQGQLNIFHIGDDNEDGHGVFREHGTKDVWYHIRNGNSTPSGGNLNPNGFGDWDEGEEARIAIAFKDGDQAISVNGGNQITATVTSNYPTANITKMWIGSHGTGSFFEGTIKRIAYYPKQLTDNQLNTLTA